MLTRLPLTKVHYHGTWESPNLPEGQWHVEQREKNFFCFYNNRLMHSIYEGKKTFADAIQFCEGHYHQLLKENYDGKVFNRSTK